MRQVPGLGNGTRCTEAMQQAPRFVHQSSNSKRERESVRMMRMAKILMVCACNAIFASCLVAQAPTVAPLPQDQQAPREQIARLFEVMRLRQQMESMMKSLPAMVQQQIQTTSKELTEK